MEILQDKGQRMFTVIDTTSRIPQGARARVFLLTDNWDDWFSYRTMFTVIVFDQYGNRHSLGSVKIGQAGLLPMGAVENLPPNARIPNLPTNFKQLDPSAYFSLGQNEDYYSTLASLPQGFGVQILERLCDCAFNLEIFRRHRNELVMIQSLLRSVPEANVSNRLHRLAHGNAELTRFEFNFIFPLPDNTDAPPPPPTTMQFLVQPNVEPPTNLHVLVGRNGAGKTRCIQSLVNTLLGWDSEEAPRGVLELVGDNQNDWAFSGLVSVSFSAFDRYLPPPANRLRIPAAFVGLRTQRQDDAGQNIDELKSPQELARDFVQSLLRCRDEPRRSRWLRAVATLATDPLFAEASVEQLFDYEGADWELQVTKYFGRLSSGHAIVLLTTTRLVELVDERTLVVLDEPEGHLHPPLLSAFIRTISNLLVERNGVAFISTHSPVVLQEVPQSCVWMLRRTRTRSAVERPGIETFGESAGILTREVFGLEVTHSGFHQLVSSVARKPGQTYENVEAHFAGQLGSEAKILARSLIMLTPE